jgi:hypothetical protein
MNNWRHRWRQSHPPPRHRAAPPAPRIEAVPIGNIDALLMAVIRAMNAIPPSDDFDTALATRLYYTVMCLKRFFPEWGVYLTPVYSGNRFIPSRVEDQGFSEPENDSETEPLISDV